MGPELPPDLAVPLVDGETVEDGGLVHFIDPVPQPGDPAPDADGGFF